MPPAPDRDLRTARLWLRPFREDDVADALAYRNDRRFSQFLPHIPYPFTWSDAQDFVATNRSDPWERSATFAVVHADRLIGTVTLEIDAPARSAMLGYAIGRSWWGRGLASEAARAVLDWGAVAYGLRRIWACADARNLASHRVLQKLGMHLEQQRSAAHRGRQGELVQEVVYALERPDAVLPAALD